jgi:hypothetical protein
MDNFDFKKYLAENRIHADHDLLSEKKEDSKKGNKEEQKRLEGAIRDNRDHKFDIDKDEDDQRKKLAKLKKDAKKEDGKGKKGNEDEQKRAEGAIKDAKDHKKALNKDIKADEKKLAKLKKDFKKDVVKEGEEVEEGYGKPMYDEDDTKPMEEDAMSKMKISELKAKIREDILATLAEADEVTEAEEDVDVDIDDEVEADVNVDVKDTVDVDAEGDEIDIVKPAVKAKVEVGLSPEEEIVQDSLKAAMDAADALGNDKLADQIGNTITFFTREYVVGRNTD